MNIGDIHTVNIEQQMREAYLDYAMSVIVARALPDARDGLKPVHRRILYAMYDMGLTPGTSYKKSARIVGEVLGKYHPHGDGAVYDAMVRLAQDFSMRYRLVDGQGNFGSIDGDSAAAMRYTEARMARLGRDLLDDIEKNTVDFSENFDGSLEEPAVLPASLPNLLINGASGIAVGMSTNIPPHNLGEVVDALVYMLSHWNRLDEIDIDDLMQFIKGPDFPTGGMVYSHSDTDATEDSLKQAYATGRGKITVRAKVHLENMGRGKSRIIVSELPYQVNKTNLIERIASLVNNGKIEGIADLRDESDRQNLVRLVIELQRGVDTTDVLAKLFKLTPLQETFSIIMLALVDAQPRYLTLKQALRVYLEHRLVIVERRSQYDLQRARERAHILEGLLKALDNLDEIIDTIRRSRTVDTARNNLMSRFTLSEAQAQAILDTPLRRLASLERKKIKDEYEEKRQTIAYLEELLDNPQKIRIVIAEELTNVKHAYADPRRTIITGSTASSISATDFLMPEEVVWVTLTVDHKLGRSFDNTQPTISTKIENPPYLILQGSTNQTLYLFTSTGDCATIPVQQLPQVSDPAEGGNFYDLCTLTNEDAIVAALILPMSLNEGFLFMTTDSGQVKRSRLADLPGVSARAFGVMKVGKQDRLNNAFITDGQQPILLTTAAGQSIRFSEDEVRPTGLAAGGMRGIKLTMPKDRVVSATTASDQDFVWTITDDGIAKISPLAEYPLQGRAGAGVIAMRLPKGSREIVAATTGSSGDSVIVITNSHKIKNVPLAAAPRLKRGKAGGDGIISLDGSEYVVGLVQPQPKFEPFAAAEPANTDTDTDQTEADPSVNGTGNSPNHA
jgi:DNA gyrase subunit A